MVRELLLQSEPLLLFIVIGLGYLLGQAKLGGVKIGVVGVLFAGVAIGAWQPVNEPRLAISHQISQIGLILFVYTIGLTAAPGFFASFRRRGGALNLSVVAALILGGLLALFLGQALGLSAEMIAGVYSGTLTNTPGLAAVTELVQFRSPENVQQPTLAYSISYPIGIGAALLVTHLITKLFATRFQAEKEELASQVRSQRNLVVRNFQIVNPEIFGKAIGELRVQDETGLRITRVQHKGRIKVVTKYTRLEEGDILVAVGKEKAIKKGEAYFGKISPTRIEQCSEEIVYRRILLSDRRLVGRTLKRLDLERKYNAQVTRLRRGDIDLATTPDTVLEMGDRLRVVMPKEQVGAISNYLGNSELQRADVDFAALTFGISLGVLLGMIPIPIPGGATVSLGFAGGPLVAGLLGGRLYRTGPFTWLLPLEANLALRHIGLLFFLAGMGVTAGSYFTEALGQMGFEVLILALVVVLFTQALMFFFLFYGAKSTITAAMGATSGMHTQSAVLARAKELSGSDEVFVAYATTYPAAMICKIVIAQLLVLAGG